MYLASAISYSICGIRWLGDGEGQSLRWRAVGRQICQRDDTTGGGDAPPQWVVEGTAIDAR